jgi:hypothetical protein
VCITWGWQARLSQLCDANDYGGQRLVHELAHELLVGLQVLAAAPANPVTLACCANSGDIERARARERESLADKERGRSEIAREKREREVSESHTDRERERESERWIEKRESDKRESE